MLKALHPVLLFLTMNNNYYQALKTITEIFNSSVKPKKMILETPNNQLNAPVVILIIKPKQTAPKIVLTTIPNTEPIQLP